jgi:hypothetical protein
VSSAAGCSQGATDNFIYMYSCTDKCGKPNVFYVVHCYGCSCSGSQWRIYSIQYGECGGGIPACPAFTPLSNACCAFLSHPTRETCGQCCHDTYDPLLRLGYQWAQKALESCLTSCGDFGD